ncbi:MAG: hypothetical protein ABR583_06205 [Gaiellaceae bacterium]
MAPIEIDANAASARFAWQRYGADVCRPLCEPVTHNGALFRSHTPPAPLETLPKRMLAFLLQFADLCERVAARRGRPFADLLEEAWPGAAEVWAALDEIALGPPRVAPAPD